jgi:hypothetical protein
MNKKTLYILEKNFLSKYIDGFYTEELKKISKKHNISKLGQYAKEVLIQENLEKGLWIIDDIVKLITKSSMVSVFEKVRFKEDVKALSDEEKSMLIYGIKEWIHGDEEEGFNTLVFLLEPYKLAKWTIITAFRVYYYLDYDVLIKPTTVKKVIQILELEDIEYTSKLNYYFYYRYREYINEMKELVDKRLSPNNPAFSGFLMMAIDEL